MNMQFEKLLEQKVQYLPMEKLASFPEVKIQKPRISLEDSEKITNYFIPMRQNIIEYLPTALPVEKEGLVETLEKFDDLIVKYNYPKADASFLSSVKHMNINNLDDVNEIGIIFPSFCIFDLLSDDATFKMDYNISVEEFDTKNKLLSFGVTPNNLHNDFLINLLGNTLMDGITDEWDKKYGLAIEGAVNAKTILLNLQRRFLIPFETKKKINKSRPYFSKDKTLAQFIPKKDLQQLNQSKNGLYLVAEINSQDWDVQLNPYIERDPLIMGGYKSNLYLVDSFDTTSLEQLIIKRAK